MSGTADPRGATLGVAPVVPAVVVGQTLTPTTVAGLSFLGGAVLTGALVAVLHRQHVFEDISFLQVSRVDPEAVRELYESVVDRPGEADDTTAEKVAAIRSEIEGEPEGDRGDGPDKNPPNDGESASAPVDEATRAQSIDAEAMAKAVADESPPPDSSAGRLGEALDPESERDPIEPLKATVDAASNYDYIEETFGTTSEETVRQRADDLRKTLSEMDGPAARAVDSTIERLLEDVSTPFSRSPRATVAVALLDYVGDELPEEAPGESSLDGSLDDRFTRYDDRRSEVKSEFENDNNGVSSDGNKIASEFVELAESLREEARSRSADGETEAARVRIDAAVRILDQTLDLYKERHLRNKLTRV